MRTEEHNGTANEFLTVSLPMHFPHFQLVQRSSASEGMCDIVLASLLFRALRKCGSY